MKSAFMIGMSSKLSVHIVEQKRYFLLDLFAVNAMNITLKLEVLKLK
jgi:hypothetical protein